MIAVQVAIGVLIVYCIYRMSLWLLKKDELVINEKTSKNPKETYRIVNGYVHTTLATNRSWSTINPNARNYARIRRSYNRKGGAQYSYGFWLFLDDTTPENVGNKDLILRGDSSPYTYQKRMVYDDGLIKDVVNQDITGIVVKAPRIRFGPTHDSFVVELNTLHNPDEKIRINPVAASEDSTLRHNVLKLMQHKWVMLTFTFEDNVAINDFEDGIVVRFFVNDLLYHTASIKSTLRPNNGDFYLLPSTQESSIKNGRIGDVFYYNYAVSHQMVKERFTKGPPKYPCTDLMGGDDMGDPLYLSEYNKLDIYNT